VTGQETQISVNFTTPSNLPAGTPFRAAPWCGSEILSVRCGLPCDPPTWGHTHAMEGRYHALAERSATRKAKECNRSPSNLDKDEAANCEANRRSPGLPPEVGGPIQRFGNTVMAKRKMLQRPASRK
jgi:hypothetical protein